MFVGTLKTIEIMLWSFLFVLPQTTHLNPGSSFNICIHDVATLLKVAGYRSPTHSEYHYKLQ